MRDKALFFLGINALKLDKQNLALKFFADSNKKAKYRFDKDKTLFWSYLITTR